MSRGYNNNNPGNIRKTSDLWQGEVEGTDQDFKTFESMSFGYRAIVVLLNSYFNKRGLNNVQDIISTYAPGNENNTEAYIKAVCQRTGFDRDQVLDFNDPDTIKSLMAAISYVENGISADNDEIESGYNLYYNG